MADIQAADAFPLGDHSVQRMDYVAMELAGAGVFGPPRDHAAALAALAVLREAVASGVDHIDTSDFYRLDLTNRLFARRCPPSRRGL